MKNLLSKTNPYIKKIVARRRMIAENARESSILEGARSLRTISKLKKQRSGYKLRHDCL